MPRVWYEGTGEASIGLNIAIPDLDNIEDGEGMFANIHHESWWSCGTEHKNQRPDARDSWGTLRLMPRVREKFMGRKFYPHNPNVTPTRTTPEECARLGQIIAGKLNASKGPATVLISLKGISVIAALGGAFHWPEADAVTLSRSWYQALCKNR